MSNIHSFHGLAFAFSRNEGKKWSNNGGLFEFSAQMHSGVDAFQGYYTDYAFVRIKGELGVEQAVQTKSQCFSLKLLCSITQAAGHKELLVVYSTFHPQVYSVLMYSEVFLRVFCIARIAVRKLLRAIS